MFWIVFWPGVLILAMINALFVENITVSWAIILFEILSLPVMVQENRR